MNWSFEKVPNYSGFSLREVSSYRGLAVSGNQVLQTDCLKQ